MHAASSLLTELPELIAQGRLRARQALERNRGVRPATNLLLHGDNLEGLARLVASGARAKLIYLDPPFDSKADYRSRIHTRDDSGAEIALEMHTYTDRWAGGTADYLRMLVPRLVLAREALREDGAICVHLDWHSSHYVRVVLDEIFGREKFVNSLVWSYRTGGAARTSAVPRKHDDLLIYRRSDKYRVTPLYERQYLSKSFMGSKMDAQGRHYVDTILRDVLEGVVNLITGPEVSAGQGTSAAQEVGVRPVSVRPVLNLSGERTGYATQKPEGLLELLLRWMTVPRDLVVDPFGGSGTTAAAAEQLGRQWVSMDASARSLAVTRSRLDALGAQYGVEDLSAETLAGELIGDEFATRLSGAAEFELAPTGFELMSVRTSHALSDALEPARGQAQDSVARALGGSGLGSLAGWHLWHSDAQNPTSAGLCRRVAGAWRDPRGNLATRASVRVPASGHLALELIDLVGGRVTIPVPRGDAREDQNCTPSPNTAGTSVANIEV